MDQGNIRLFANALHDKKVMMAREQLALALWTKPYRNISRRFSQSYIRKELVDWIWNDQRHDRTFLAAEGHQLLMAAREDKADFAARALVAETARQSKPGRLLLHHVLANERSKIAAELKLHHPEIGMAQAGQTYPV